MMPTLQYSITMIKDEARHLVDVGFVERLQPIYSLCRYIPSREWKSVELELENHGYLLRDRIVDLLGREDWRED
ncbi:DUF4327 family protein [Roseofilum sp. Belize Diploria]|uniref:DUF4327 family protein n=2 Tax=unclassified Roseofilum TaxID=2620099 RepID=UPI000E912C7F|nr:DUF4327 family protein [Roseofilum sp. Belize Diploria]MBP0011015.1 DUF4327 family protein [Roseofilum sp. Belize Diploria]MBP0036008.1 DUF4327 family protein [Roseofilum sp. Belize BBD 4]HBQ97470.1 DUF4327 domain-containing protein [Cyanobacteria bacterium UBA11691]